jgi:hypothetical protein
MEDLKDKITQEIQQLFEGILDFVQVAVPEDRWKPLRSKILRLGNNCIRNLHNYVDTNL